MHRVEQLAQEGHGCVQTEADEGAPLVVLGGPIKKWWADDTWDSNEHKRYVEWRDAMRVGLVKLGYCVYSPHRALQGSWTERAQRINDAAIQNADLFVALMDATECGHPSVEGTTAEVDVASLADVDTWFAPPGDDAALDRHLWSIKMLVQLKQRRKALA